MTMTTCTRYYFCCILADIRKTVTTGPSLQEQHTTNIMVEITRKSVLGFMPHQSLTKIHGEPMHKTVKKLEKELGSNLIAVPFPWGQNKGHLGIFQDTVVFTGWNSGPYTPQAAAPPVYPAIPVCVMVTDWEQLKVENDEQQQV